jgi:23S rRNA pseudouridine1911/1915/1917 synthase
MTGQEEGKRLDRVLADHFPDEPRVRFRDWIEEGRVRVGGEARKPAYRVRRGDAVTVNLPALREIEIPAESIPVPVLYEDECLLVVDKPAGLTTHPAPHQPTGTLVNALMGRGTELSDWHGDRFRPGIVHRLDRGTSGVLVVAKSRIAHAALAEQFEHRTLDKEYRAVALGRPEAEEGEIDLPIGRDRHTPLRMAVRQDVGREARTRYRVLERFPRHAYFALYLDTGRTHQIRVHLSALGHPVLADSTYRGGPPEVTASALAGEAPREGERPILARPALHAFRLSFDHPATGERMTFTAPLPEDFEAVLRCLRG